MADFNINHITGKQGQQGTVLAGITTVSSTGAMRIPSGPTAYRGNRGRAIWAGQYAPSRAAWIDYVNLSTTGNTVDFGYLVTSNGAPCGIMDSTRGIICGGDETVASTDRKQWITISSTGNAIDYGDLLQKRNSLPASMSDSTRGVVAGGTYFTTPSGGGDHIFLRSIEYETIQTLGTGNDFGDLETTHSTCPATWSTTRGLIMGGYHTTPSWDLQNTVEYITIQSQGDAKDFGDLVLAMRSGGGASNGTRGIHAAGRTPSNSNQISYVTLASTGDFTDFGDLTTALGDAAGNGGNTRGVFGGGGGTNIINYITIATTGNASDFGDFHDGGRSMGATVCDQHGGLEH